MYREQKKGPFCLVYLGDVVLSGEEMALAFTEPFIRAVSIPRQRCLKLVLCVFNALNMFVI